MGPGTISYAVVKDLQYLPRSSGYVNRPSLTSEGLTLS